MEEATLTSKSQITLPKAVRESLGAVPGDKIRFVPSLNGYRLIPVKGDVSKLRGMPRGRVKKPVTIEEMNEAIGDAVVERYKRAVSR